MILYPKSLPLKILHDSSIIFLFLHVIFHQEIIMIIKQQALCHVLDRVFTRVIHFHIVFLETIKGLNVKKNLGVDFLWILILRHLRERHVQKRREAFEGSPWAAGEAV